VVKTVSQLRTRMDGTLQKTVVSAQRLPVLQFLLAQSQSQVPFTNNLRERAYQCETIYRKAVLSQLISSFTGAMMLPQKQCDRTAGLTKVV